MASASASPNVEHSVHSDHGQGPPRKKMRKGTRSCIDCRRRKIKCTFEPGRTSICNECFARGSICIDQEHAGVSHSTSQSSADQSNTLRERVNQLEDLVKQVLHRLPENPKAAPLDTNSDHVDKQAAAEVLKSLKTPAKQHNSYDENLLMIPGAQDDAPALSLFDNAVFSRKEVPATISRAQYNKSKSLIATLLQLLPPPNDLEIILESSQAWWTIWKTMFPNITDLRCVTIKESVSHSLRSEKPAEIAKIMLCIALSVNQLPQEFNWKRLSIKDSREDLMERYISTVNRLIISDDEIAATVDGLECMLLEAKYHVNMGRPRRSWLLYHRALAFAQLLGLHRLALRAPTRVDPEYERQLRIWAFLVMGDRFLSLMLGLPYSVAEVFCAQSLRLAASRPKVAAGEAYLARMAPLMTRMIDRNQSPVPVPYSVTLSMDTDIEEIHASTDPHWWTPERLPGSTIEEHFDRLQAQFYHHQIRVLLHMPFMLRSATDKRYHYSHTATLDSTREMIRYYDALRDTENVGPYICKLVDFQAFTAAMLLVLNLCGYAQHSRGTKPQQPDLDQDQQDSALIDRIITLLRSAANEAGGVVAEQCVKALDMVARVRSGCPHAQKDAAVHYSKETAQISIPYFGTLSVGAGKQFVPIQPGTYPDAGTARKSISVPRAFRTQSGLPTPPSLTSNSSQASPGMNDHARQSPYMTSSYSADQSWTASTEDPFITFDSFMDFPDFSAGGTSSSGTPSYMLPQDPFSFENAGTLQEQNLSAGFPFPNASGSNLELDNGWNWFNVESSV